MDTPYTFGRFVFDPVALALFDEGERLRIGATELKILKILLERRGMNVSKEELMSRVWDHAIVGDNALHVHVAGLRRVLGDDVITTKRGVGYRFSAEISRGETRQRVPGNLPTAGWAVGDSTLIGRDDDLRQISQLLRTGRLVSLIGPGGVGKTSLGLRAAQECAQDFPDGVWLVELATLNEPKLVAGQIAATLGLGPGRTSNTLQRLARLLREKATLLVLDNCEHLADACAEVCETLLSAAPKVRIIVTSRHAMSCAGEIVFAVPPLALPDESIKTTKDSLRKSAAFELFIERARGAASGFQMDDSEVEIAAQICRRVDGLPLAIEMVAGWAAIFGVQALYEKLDDSIHAWPRARSTAPARQSTLAATLEWSHGLLSAGEQAILRRLSVFAGPFTMQAAEAVVSDEQIQRASVFEHVASLIRKSMIAVVPGGRPPTYRLLETTRALMAEKLAAAPEGGRVPRCHANYILDTLRFAMDELQSTPNSVWLKRYAPLLPDMRGALDWAIAEDPELAIALACMGWPLWREMSLHAEGRQWLNTITKLIGPHTPPEVGLRARRGLADLSMNTEFVGTVYDNLLDVVSQYRRIDPGPELGSALVELAFAALVRGRTDDARDCIAEAIERLQDSGWPRELGNAHSVLTVIEAASGHYAEAGKAGAKAIRLLEMVGADRAVLVVSVNLLETGVVSGEFARSVATGRDLLERLRATPYSDLLGLVLGLVACSLLLQRKHDDALPVLREATNILREEGMVFWLYDYFALRLALIGRYSDAAVISGYANSVLQNCGRFREPLGMMASRMLDGILQSTMSKDDLNQLVEGGKYLSEDRAISLALH